MARVIYAIGLAGVLAVGLWLWARQSGTDSGEEPRASLTSPRSKPRASRKLQGSLRSGDSQQPESGAEVPTSSEATEGPEGDVDLPWISVVGEEVLSDVGRRGLLPNSVLLQVSDGDIYRLFFGSPGETFKFDESHVIAAKEYLQAYLEVEGLRDVFQVDCVATVGDSRGPFASAREAMAAAEGYKKPSVVDHRGEFFVVDMYSLYASEEYIEARGLRHRALENVGGAKTGLVHRLHPEELREGI